MKKIILLMLLIICISRIYGQKRNYLSIEIDANYYYYFLGGNSSNNFNYGFSLLVSKHINKIKISSGINFSIKSYDSQGDPFYSILKREYKLDYLNFPVIANIDIISQKKFFLSIVTGFVFNHILDYNIKSYYLNGETLTENDLMDNKKLGTTLVLGTTFSKLVGNKYMLNLAPFINYKLIPDHDNQRPDYKNIPNDKISFGFKIGIEYMFETSDK